MIKDMPRKQNYPGLLSYVWVRYWLFVALALSAYPFRGRQDLAMTIIGAALTGYSSLSIFYGNIVAGSFPYLLRVLNRKEQRGGFWGFSILYLAIGLWLVGYGLFQWFGTAR